MRARESLSWLLHHLADGFGHLADGFGVDGARGREVDDRESTTS
jgi:hypothetical protein